LNQESYHKLILGEGGSLRSILLRLPLWAASQIYSIVIRLRNFLYSKGWLRIGRVNATVISVGNITVGGTGKTPLVIWLCNQVTKNSKLKTQNYGCAILTRGYRATKNSKPCPERSRRIKTQNYSDEPAILSEHCPQAKVIVNPDRVAGAVEAVSQFGSKVLIADDGFQHRRLARDLDIVTIDAGRPFGYGRMLPAGLLREPVTELKRADAVVITRCEQADEVELNLLEEKLRVFNPALIIARSVHAPVCMKSQSGEEISIEKLKGKKIFAFCGIGNPDAFFNTVKALGAELVGSKIYNDHYHYTNKDIDDIYEEACGARACPKADLILTTEKDRTKIADSNSTGHREKKKELNPKDTQYQIPLAYLEVELKFTSGEDKLKRLIEDALAGKIPKK
jgi:tetraacyldisaccharide 4'-kinase